MVYGCIRATTKRHSKNYEKRGLRNLKDVLFELFPLNFSHRRFSRRENLRWAFRFWGDFGINILDAQRKNVNLG
jgi:hypothetical protein